MVSAKSHSLNESALAGSGIAEHELRSNAMRDAEAQLRKVFECVEKASAHLDMAQSKVYVFDNTQEYDAAIFLLRNHINGLLYRARQQVNRLIYDDRQQASMEPATPHI